MRRAFTLVEILVSLAILATLLGILVPALMVAKATADGASGEAEEAEEAEKSLYLQNINHDGHLWVINMGLNCFVHHPDCPCHGKAERYDQGR